MNLGDVKPAGKIMALLVGENGMGKSCLVSSFAQAGPMKFFDFDGRMQGIVGYMHGKEYLKNIEFESYGHKLAANIKTIPQFKQEIEALLDRCPWKAICIDSLTSLSITIINYQLTVKGLGKGSKSVAGGLPVTTWDEINGETILISELLDILKVLPCHVFVTAHPVEKITIVDGESVYNTTITAYGHKVPQIVPNYFNELWQLEKDITPNGIKRILCTGLGKIHSGKTALPLPAKIDYTDNPDMYKTIQDLLKKAGMTLTT